MDVQQKVAALIRRYKTDDPFRLAACKNIIIMYSDLGGKYGNYLKYKRSKFIIIDAQRTPESMLPFVCAHELGSCALYAKRQHPVAQDLHHGYQC